jgi:hypothetical protein
MADVGPALGALSFIVFIIGAILFFVAKGRRPLAKKLLLGGAVVFVVALIMTPTLPPTPASTPAGTKAVAVAPTKPTIDQASAKPVAAVDPKPGLIGQYKAVIDTVRPCDAAFKALAGAKSSQLALYQASKKGHDACGTSSKAVDAFDVPEGLADKVQVTQRKALATCATAYRFRERAFGKAMEMADSGDIRPSRMTEMQEDFKTGEVGVLLCVSQLIQAAGEAGIKPDDLKS